MKEIFQKILKYFRNKRPYVIADPKDNSITFSSSLLRMLKKQGGKPKILVFTVNGRYAFTIDPKVDEEKTQMADLQYDTKTNTYGFELLMPQVHQMLEYYQPERTYKYSDEPARLYVRRKKLKTKDNGKLIYYEFYV